MPTVDALIPRFVCDTLNDRGSKTTANHPHGQHLLNAGKSPNQFDLP